MNAKRTSRRIVAVLLSMMMVIGCFLIPGLSVSAADETVVKIYYHREDGVYSGSDVWVWPDGGNGAAYTFTDSGDAAKGGVATITLAESVSGIGFIIRAAAGDWNTKDPDGDRSVDLSSVTSGTVNVYCEAGSDLNAYTVDYDEAVQGLKVKSANGGSDYTSVTFEMTKVPEGDDLPIGADDFVVTDSVNGVVTVSDVALDGKNGTLTLSGELDKFSDVTVTFRGTATKVTMPDYYSSEEFENLYTYDGNDLGANWTKDSTTFRVWAPTATGMDVNLYEQGDGDNLIESYPMNIDVKGTWVVTVPGDLNGKYYTYTAYFSADKQDRDIVDPYARTVGVNGNRGMVIDLDSTDPEGWADDARQTKENPTDLVIYELHVRDFSVAANSGVSEANKGKYLAFTETGTTVDNAGKTATAMDHIKDLGVTSVHLLPVYDYGSVDETKLTTKAQFNWGYDPVNYNAPEGSYSSDPYNGEVRVNEFKQMVQAFHNAGIGVIMDVVYNHTYNTTYCFNRLVPGYFHRPDSNGSGCGNDVASERAMVSKFITDSVRYWADEYHLDGFRFDLVGLLDTDTVNDCCAAVKELDQNIFMYGEGWNLTTKLTKTGVKLATQPNSALTPDFAYFSDTIRDGIRGSVFDETDKGYVGGGQTAGKIKDGVTYSKSWSASPTQTINYDSCHDNHTIWDRLACTNPENTEEERIAMNKFSAAIVFTAQGVPFVMSGEEFLRTKTKADGTFEHNSYASPDSVNELDYSRVETYADVYDYYKGLIEMRAAFPQFRMTQVADVDANLSYDYSNKGAIGYSLKGGDNDMLVFYNPNADWEVELPEGNWSVVLNNEKAGTAVLSEVTGTVTVPAISAMVLVKDYEAPVEPGTDEPGDEPGTDEPGDEPGNGGSGNNGGDNNGGNSGTDVDPQNGGNGNNGDNNGSGSGTTGGSTDVPATGDAATAVVFITLAAAAGFIALVVYRRRRFSK